MTSTPGKAKWVIRHHVTSSLDLLAKPDRLWANWSQICQILCKSLRFVVQAPSSLRLFCLKVHNDEYISYVPMTSRMANSTSFVHFLHRITYTGCTIFESKEASPLKYKWCTPTTTSTDQIFLWPFLVSFTDNFLARLFRCSHCKKIAKLHVCESIAQDCMQVSRIFTMATSK